MTQEQAKMIGGNGWYVLHWKSGGASVATVGTLHDGRRWFAAANWTAKDASGIASVAWRHVREAEPNS